MSETSTEWAEATVALSLAGESFEARMRVPAGPTRPLRLLPLFQALTDSLVDFAARRVETQGENISCRKGCGACCRQLVPLSETEVLHLRDLIEGLPQPRRAQILARFADARRRLREAGLLEKLERPDAFEDGELRPVGLAYFRLGIACPFLEEESCSIHPDRPLACREYLVTSAAQHCARPSAETVCRVKIPGKVSFALARLGEDPSRRFIPWVPLILAPDWAGAHPADPPLRTGPEILREVFEKLAQQKEASPEPEARRKQTPPSDPFR
jgi:Fe-S-cluster containining protein